MLRNRGKSNMTEEEQDYIDPLDIEDWKTEE